MFQEEEFEGHAALTEQSKSFYRASDFTGGSHKQPTREERREHRFFLIGMSILTALVLSGIYNYKQYKDNEMLKAENERLLHSSHNPFVHARK